MAKSRSTPDYYARLAKKEGHAARSVYKLKEIDDRWHILRKGTRVLDLGCFPGSWMKFAAEKVGPRGKVLGYDLQQVVISLPPNAEARQGDAFNLTPEDLGGRFEVVLSDMAPATMGDRRTDAIRSAGLVERALDVADQHLMTGGSVVCKIFEGGDVPQIIKRMRTVYEKVVISQPKATRQESTEIFLVGLRHKPRAEESAEGTNESNESSSDLPGEEAAGE